MSDFGVWESIETSDSEKKIASRKSEDKLAAAIYDVKDKYGDFLYASTALDEFHDRVALVKTDMMKTVDQHLMPVTGVMRRVIKACKDEWRNREAVHPHAPARGAEPLVSGHELGWSGDPDDEYLQHLYEEGLSGYTPEEAKFLTYKDLMEEPPPGYAEGDWDRIMDQPAPSHWQKILDDQDAREKSHAEDWKRSEQMENANREWQDSVRGKKRDEYGDIVGRRRADNTGPAMVLEETFTPSSGNLVPEGNFDGYLAEVEQGAPEKAGENFIEGKARLAFSVYKDYCETNGLRVASIDSLDHYAENLSDAQYFQLASIIQRIGSQPLPGGGGGSDSGSEGSLSAPGWGGPTDSSSGGIASHDNGLGPFAQNMIAPGQIAASRRQAAGSGKTNYLQKADEALTQVLESKAEEFQETIAPLQQALQVIQQAEQAEQAANPMGVQPPPGTVNVLPGQDPSMGGGDPSMGGDPMAGGGGDLAQALGLAGAQGMPTPGPEGAQQQITGRQRKIARPKNYREVEPEIDPEGWITRSGYSAWDCENCGGEVTRCRGEGDVSCPDCDAQYNAFGQRLRDDWRDNMSNYDDEIGDMEGYEDAMAAREHEGSRGGRRSGGAYPFVRKGGILDQYNSWLKRRKDLPRGGEADYWAFARENGFGENEVNSLKKHFQTTAAKVSLSDGEMGSYPRTSGVRGQRSGASPVGGSNRSSSTRESNPSRQGASAGGRKARLSNRNTGNPRASDDSLSGGSGVSWSQTGEARGTASQRSGSRQSSGEPGVWDQGSEHAGHGRSRHAVVPEENSMSRRASAGRAESSGFPVEAGLEVMQGVSGRTQMGQASSWDGGSDRSRSVLSENNVRKLAWSGFGFGPSSFQPKVAGWIWDSHLNGYIANAANKFACSCGESFDVPSYHNCKCGKIYNSYVIGTGGDNHTASIEKYICREIQVRPDVIVANRKAKRHRVTDPGALGDGEEDDLPTMKPVPQDWRRRNEHGQFSAKRR